jgi:hypothetical protein
MNCHDIQRTLIDALYGDLSAQARREVEAHRATCADCAKVWTSLQAMHQALGQWPDVSPPAGLRARVLARVATQSHEVKPQLWWRQGLAGTGLSVAAGLVMMVTTVVLLSRFLVLEALAPRSLLICGSLWGGAYIGLFRLTLSEVVWTERPWLSSGLHLARAAGMALLAIGVATLLMALLTVLPLESLTTSIIPASWLTFLGGGTVALVALGLSSWGLRGRALDARPILHALLAACFFILAVAPGLLMFCVPFTMGVYLGLLLAVSVGASAGGALGILLRTQGMRYAQP